MEYRHGVKGHADASLAANNSELGFSRNSANFAAWKQQRSSSMEIAKSFAWPANDFVRQDGESVVLEPAKAKT
ncbi:MAG: hypothetical protein O2960_25430 [Verrucomicrobia bacterium]|nr:hypothetical protein [Verrucomicrobiota bacterium]